MSASVLAASALAGVVIPQRVASALDTAFESARGRAEFRIVYATLAAVGVWALVIGDSEVFIAVGLLWLGAAAVRIAALLLDRPRPDRTYWAYLVLGVGLGLAGVLGSG
ncbi:MAG: hypothetical protein WD770_08110 [Actinomycetota bacterium]